MSVDCSYFADDTTVAVAEADRTWFADHPYHVTRPRPLMNDDVQGEAFVSCCIDAIYEGAKAGRRLPDFPPLGLP